MIQNKQNILNFKKLLKAFLSVSFIYLIGTLVPILGFLIPVWKIRENKNLYPRGRMTLNILLLLEIVIFSSTSLSLYLGLYLIIEILYYIFKYLKIKIKIFDRIIITSLISTVLVLIFLNFMDETILTMKKTVEEIYTNQYNLNKAQLTYIFEFIKNYKLYLVYVYSGITTYFTYMIVENKSYKEWKISYEWIGIYIFSFFMMKLGKVQPKFFENIVDIIKISYIMYGIKVVSNVIYKSLRKDLPSQILGIITGILLSNFIFILGVLESFDVMKIKIMKIDKK